MKPSSPQKILTKGLLSGFAGSTELKDVQRAGFSLQSSSFQEEDASYHDEWAADRTGGGQELIRSGDKTFTRVYAGGTISVEAMEKLGTTKKKVMEFLISSLNKAGEATRLYENYGPVQDGEWTYQYQVLEQNTAIPMTTGKEEISYKGQVVFVHVFVMCPVE